MQNHKSRIISIIAVVWSLSFPTAAQEAGPKNQQGTISEDNFVKLQQQIKELNNPTFRAFLRMRLLSWESTEPGPAGREAVMNVAIQGITDLCEHQDEVWSPTASWLHENFVKRIKNLQSAEVEICALKIDPKSVPEREFSSAVKMLKTSETSAAGLSLAKAALLSGQVSPGAMLGSLLSLSAANSPHLPELLSAILALEERQPGTLPLQMMPFFTSSFLEKSVPPEILKRFLSVAVRSSRRSAEELADLVVRSQVTQLLNGIIVTAQQHAPELYPEIASRLSSLDRTALSRTEMRLAAEVRIQKASDQLEQLVSEAESTSYEGLKKYFLFRAARLAKEQGQLSRAVDLATRFPNDRTWINSFLSEIVSLAVKKRTPLEATHAISKMSQPLQKAGGLRLLGEYYGVNQDKVKSREAFTQSAKELKAVENGIEKVRASLLLADSVLKYQPADAYEVFCESVNAINNLPSPDKDHVKMYFVHLLPVAEDLIRSFRVLATVENETAISLATEIKVSELRLAALGGTYCRPY